LVADEGLALFCGLNAMPKKSFLSEYSSRITPQKVQQLLSSWHSLVAEETILTGKSINLDFHSTCESKVSRASHLTLRVGSHSFC